MSALAENERGALERLLAIAAADTGTSRRVADFLLSWWNKSSCGGFDLVDLWYFSEDIAADCLTIFRFVSRNREYPDGLGYGKQFEALVRAWRPSLSAGAPAPAIPEDDGEDLRERNCAHEWAETDPDEDPEQAHHGEGRMYCTKCGADGDA